MGFLLLGIDSVIVCAAIGGIVDRRSRVPLAALFGIADGIAFLIGSAIGLQISAEVGAVLQTATLVALGIYLVVVAGGTPRLVRWPVWAVPFALAFDNLAYGLVDRSAGSVLAQAGQQALSSALLALAALVVAGVLPRVIPAMNRSRTAATQFAGAALILAAGVELLAG
jgi:hypothetical protein